MSVTVLNEDSATIVSDESPRRFSWSAAFAGAFVAAGVSFLLITLGSGVGLSLVSVRHATTGGAISFLSAGAIYFLAAQAFGFAVGGHVVGRLIGPAVETDKEEEFRAGVHGLVSWAIAVVATATLVALSVLVAGSATGNGAVNGALASSAPATARGEGNANATTSYWVDKLFRPANNTQAALAWRQYAQADTGTTTDVPPNNGDATTPLAPSDTTIPSSTDATGTTPDNSRVTLGNESTAPAAAPVGAIGAGTPTLRSIGADKAEAGRILTVGMANGGTLAGDDAAQLTRLVETDTGLTTDAARSRVDDVARRIHDDEVQAAEIARKTAAFASLWTAFALLFGAAVAIAAAISARWEDDKRAGIVPGTRVEETRY
jgi:energy-converting hydrogenase Eha subunit A